MEAHTTKTLGKVEFKDMPARPCIIISRRVPFAQMAPFFQEAFGKLYPYGMRLGQVAECFARYQSWTETECEVEAGVVVDHPMAASGEIRPSIYGGHRALYMRHVGPYSEATRTYDAIQEYAKSHEIPLAKSMYEVYLDSPESVPEDKLRTDVYWPLA